MSHISLWSNQARRAVKFLAGRVSSVDASVNRLTGGPKVVTGIALLAIAISFSQKVCHELVWFFIILTCLLILLSGVAAKFKKGPWRRGLLICGLCCVLLVGFGVLLTEPPLLPITFAESEELSWLTKYRVTRGMTLFHAYLAQVGFDLPHAPPPVSLGSIRSAVVTRGDSNPSSWSLEIDEHDPGNGELVRIGYASVLFSLIFDRAEAMRSHPLHRMQMASYFAHYFTYSYSGRPEPHPVSWMLALWDLRAKFGKDFVDHCLLYTLTRLKPPATTEQASGLSTTDFNSYFAESFLRGESGMDPGGRKVAEIEGVFRQYGIRGTR
jgi:hypothetical protein